MELDDDELYTQYNSVLQKSKTVFLLRLRVASDSER